MPQYHGIMGEEALNKRRQAKMVPRKRAVNEESHEIKKSGRSRTEAKLVSMAYKLKLLTGQDSLLCCKQHKNPISAVEIFQG